MTSAPAEKGRAMSRYIYAKWLSECFPDKGEGNWTYNATAKAYIESAPSIDIVRCKDCKHAHMTYDGLCKYCDTWKDDDGNLLELYLDGDYYCADGEREGE